MAWNPRFRRLVVETLGFPIVVLSYVFVGLYKVLFEWWLEPIWGRRFYEELAKEVRQELAFLFTEHGAEIVPNREDPVLAMGTCVTIRVYELLILVVRFHDEISCYVVSERFPEAWADHDLSIVIQAMKTSEWGYSRPGYSMLMSLAKVLRPQVERLRSAFSESGYAALKPILDEIRQDDWREAKQMEEKINRRLANL